MIASPINTARLQLRRWEPSDAILLKEAIDSSLPELQLWVDWTLDHPMSLQRLESQLATMRNGFAIGADWTFAIFDLQGTRLLGGAGVHSRGSRDRVELGYWLRSDATGQGYALEAATSLCTVAFSIPEVTRIDILCDVHNVRSAAVAQRLGFTLAETFPQRFVTSRGTQRDTQRWTLSRGAGGPIRYL
ncbi:MAG TPA: GNAT family protein [Vicinamibacterales bacterium]|nr:GNAT family protein [Vicinamibacterales bacterium]